MVYHVKDDALGKIKDGGTVVRYPPLIAIEPVAFLSRILSDVGKSTSRHTANKKIIREMEYISQCNMEAIHRKGHDHIVPDALSRSRTHPPHTDPTAPGQLEELLDDKPELWVAAPYGKRAPVAVYTATEAEYELPVHATMMRMSQEFRAKIKTGYLNDPIWKRVLDTVSNNDALATEDRALLPFRQEDGLFYKVTSHKEARVQAKLCIPHGCVEDVFDALHTGNHRG
ncbi:hypothetical protein PWT90_03757 [Aphanocladium album]|nr:hypothetical protein PWT90_03757 [Aphanocladium album]